MKRFHPAWALSLVLTAALGASAAQVGDPAAPLSIATWAKGQAVDLEAVRGKKVVVVEFWATWCGPCISSIPHLTELAKKYKDNALFVGVTREESSVVEPFLAKMGDKMDYIVAIDKDGKTHDGYMTAYKQGGIPHAFIVDRDGKVAWHAHPMTSEFENALQEVIAGTFDPAAARKQQEEQARVTALMNDYFKLASETEKSEKLVELEKQLIKDIWQSHAQLNAFAWTIATRDLAHGDLELALKAALQAAKLTKTQNGDILDTCARVLWELGRKDEAIGYQEQAVKHANTDRERETFQKTLAGYTAE